MRIARFPAFLARVSGSDEEFAGGEGLVARTHLVSSGRAWTQDPIYRAPSGACRYGFSHRADASRGDLDDRWGRRVGDALGRRRRAVPERRHQDHPTSRDQVPTFTRNALFNLYRV